MDLQTITMPGETEAEQRNSARKAFLEYRHAVRERHNKEDEQIMRGYRELSRGRQLIHLTDTIKAGGVDDRGLPRLAVIRADAIYCHVRRWRDGSFVFTPGPNFGWGRRQAGQLDFSEDTLPVKEDGWLSARALVPLVPPQYRPGIAITNFHLLWEAEWRRVAPRDPALLRHLGGDLYAVVATWDLTDLERAVLSGRFK